MTSRSMYLNGGLACLVAGGFCAAGLGGFFQGTGTIGAGPIPLGSHDLRSASRLVVQALICAWVLFAPGLAALRFIGGGEFPRWSVASVLGSAAILACCEVALLNLMLSLLMPPGVATWTWRVLVGVSPFACHAAIREFALLIRRDLGRTGRWGLGVGALLYLALAATMAATPYPSLEQFDSRFVYEDLRDAPALSRVAANLVETGEAIEDYFAGDFVDGTYGYLTRMSLIPVGLLASHFRLCGVSPHAGFLIQLFAGLVGIVVAAEIVGGRLDRARSWFAALLLFLIPVVLVPVVLGSPGCILTLAVVVLVRLGLDARPDIWTNRAVIFVIACGLPLIRPEGIVIAVIVSLICVVILARSKKLSLFRSAVVGVVLIGLMWTAPWAAGINRLGPRCSHLTYVKYDVATASFAPTTREWLELNYELSLRQLRGERPPDFSNPDFASEVWGHPVAYGRYMLARGIEGMATLGESLIGDRSVGLVAMMLLACLAAGRRAHVSLVFATLAFLTGLQLLNPGATLRHHVCAHVVLLTLSLRVVVPWCARLIPRWTPLPRAVMVGSVFAAALLVGSVQLAHSMRGHKKNRASEAALLCLRGRVSKGDCVASVNPPLVSCATGARSVGGTQLLRVLDSAINRWKPDFLFFDDAPGRRAYSRFLERDRPVFGYQAVVHDRIHRFVILQKRPQGVSEPIAVTGSSE